MNILVTVAWILVAIVLYFLPTIITWKRRPWDYLEVLVWNTFMAWTVVGWVMLLGLSLTPNEHLRKKS